MKRKLLLYTLLVILFTACTRSSDDLPTPAGSTANGSWKVTFYWDEKDETSDFSGWSLAFQADGKAVATKGTTVVTGTWAKSSSTFTLNFGADPLLSSLNDDWQIIAYTDTSIKLKDDNPTQDDELHLGR